VIEQLSGTYPYKKAWRWTGHRWSTAHASLGESYLPVALGIILVLLIFWLPLALRSPSGPNTIIFWTLLAVLMVLVPPLMIWLAYRR
jgi:hypothetical protein